MADDVEDEQALEVLPAAQAFLFEAWPEQPALVQEVKRYLHSGRHAVRNAERVRDVVEAVLNGASKRAVAAHYHIGRQTIDALFEQLEKSGDLLPLKQRLAADWLETVRLTQWRIQEALVKGKMPLQVLGMLAGVGTDKIKDLTHSLPAETEQKTIDVTPESILAALRGEVPKAAQSAASDAASDGAFPNVLSVNGCLDADTVSDTSAEGSEEGGGDRDSARGADGGGDGTKKF
jgi:hypothetical protein